MIESGRLTAAIGSSRSGKSAYIQSTIAGEKRLLVWDVKGEYPGCVRARSKAELIAMVKKSSGKAGRIAFYPPTLADFDYFCRAAGVWVKAQSAAGFGCSLVFEETADVTSPGKAPESYGILLRRYLSYGVNIYAVTQRPAESDKTAVGNASIVRICRLQLSRDRKSAANDTGVPLDVVSGLRADQDNKRFDFVHCDTGAGTYRRGLMTIKAGKPAFGFTGKAIQMT